MIRAAWGSSGDLNGLFEPTTSMMSPGPSERVHKGWMPTDVSPIANCCFSQPACVLASECTRGGGYPVLGRCPSQPFGSAATIARRPTARTAEFEASGAANLSGLRQLAPTRAPMLARLFPALGSAFGTGAALDKFDRLALNHLGRMTPLFRQIDVDCRTR
jgi:hypothetical protein